MRDRTKLRSVLVVVATLGILATFAVPGYTDGSTVTRGEFAAFATAAPGNPNASTYGDAAGHTQMIRTAEGKTIVTTHVTGLLPNTTYGSHVHAAPCALGDANGHYKDDPFGPATPPNELWPGFTTDGDGVGNGKDRASWTAGPSAVSVVVHAPDGAKIACADLA